MTAQRWRLKLLDILTYTVLSLGCLMAVAPIIWGLLSSLKKQVNVVLYPPQWFPSPITFEHYWILLTERGIPRFFLNSAVLAVGTIVLVLLVAAPGAYAAAR